jgi:hypothetical protein
MTVAAVYRKRLQAAPVGQAPGRSRQEAVEQTFVPVFGHVDHTGVTTDCSRFVFETAHGLEGNGFNQTGVAGRDLEHIAMPSLATQNRAALEGDSLVLETLLTT